MVDYITSAHLKKSDIALLHRAFEHYWRFGTIPLATQLELRDHIDSGRGPALMRRRLL